eukprot:3868982-Amphidinium_carterae.1
MARHGGASRDYLLKIRTLEEIQKRGVWKSQASVRRYEKSGVLQRFILKIPGHVWRWSVAAEQRLSAVLSQPAKSVVLPEWPQGHNHCLLRSGQVAIATRCADF